MWHLTSRKGMGQLHNNYCTSQSNTGKSTSSSVRYIYPSCKEKVVLGSVADTKVKTKNTPAKTFSSIYMYLFTGSLLTIAGSRDASTYRRVLFGSTL
jgi:hypothetical protein